MTDVKEYSIIALDRKREANRQKACNVRGHGKPTKSHLLKS
uniref:Uncharacterized protein n=1 Tax=viral metagenome TaxID=1070528 RepID=A0A6C0C2R6_9ZZZZ